MITFVFAEPYPESDREFMLWLFQEYERLMFSIVQRYIPDYATQEDVVQDSLEKLIKKVNTLRGMENFLLAQYIVSTIRNTSINYLRRQERREKKVISLEVDKISEIAAEEPTLDELMMLAEERASLSKIWPLLSIEEQILLEGKYLLEESDQTLAEHLGCKPDSVRMKLTRARRKALKILLEKDGDFNDNPREAEGAV